MGWFSKRRIRSRGHDSFTIDLPGPERALLASLPQQMRELLATDDPALERLFPPAYTADAEAQADYRDLMHDDLLAHRRSSLEVLEATVERGEVTGDELAAWMGAVNDVRLVLGTRLDVTDDGPNLVADDDPAAPSLALYHYLSMLLEEIVQALSGGLPDDGHDDLVQR